ncbi:4'-phosphopantetheinyl transferase sfp [compost metagenome]
MSWEAVRGVPPLGDEVHVWRVALDAEDAVVQRCIEGLSPAERERAAKFVQPRDARRFQVARGTLRRLLGAYLSVEPAAVPIGVADNGKPRLVSPCADALRFNVSHSGDVALVAVARSREVGVDLEAVRPMRDLAGLWRMVASPVEALRLESVPKDRHEAAFYRVWTRKEAWLKATGDGLSRPLQDVEVAFLDGEAPALVHVAGMPEAGERWAIVALPVDGFEAALAVEGRAGDIRLLEAA